MNELPPPSPPASPSPLQRVLTMILFAIALWILGWVIVLTAIVQLVLRLAGGNVNADLARFGGNLARYAREVIEYLTFATDEAPFPFRPWSA